VAVILLDKSTLSCTKLLRYSIHCASERIAGDSGSITVILCMCRVSVSTCIKASVGSSLALLGYLGVRINL
jgi:hypothetical protein